MSRCSTLKKNPGNMNNNQKIEFRSIRKMEDLGKFNHYILLGSRSPRENIIIMFANK